MTGYYNIYEEYGLKHYQLPKVFFTNESYLKMSNDAKIAWAILRDRFSLSAKNNWYDDLGNIFFIFTNEDLAGILGKSVPTVVKIKKELTDNKLLYQKRTGLNQANRLYLLKPKVTEQDVYTIKEQEENAGSPTAPTEVKNFKVKKLNNLKSRSKESLSQEVKDFNSNDTDFKETDINNTDSINHHHEGFTKKQSDLINRFLAENNINHDDDDFALLIGKLKEYKPNSLEYIKKTYETVLKEKHSPQVKKPAAASREVIPDWFKDRKTAEKDKKNPPAVSQEQIDYVADRLKKYAAENE